MENKNTTTLPQAGELLITTREQRGVSANYLVTLRAMLAKLGRAFPGPLRDLSAGSVEDFLATMKPRTANNYLMLLRQLVKFARRRKLLPRRWDDLDAVEKRIVPPVDLKIYSPAEVRRILDACDETILPVVLLTVFAGVRLAESLRMTWVAVDHERKQIEVTAANSKTRSRRLCRLSPNLAAWLASCAAKRELMIFAGTRKAFGDRLRLAFLVAGLTPRRNGLRHSFVSYHLAAGGSAAVTALEAGHTEAMLFRHYRELVSDQAAREFWAIWPESQQIELKLAI